MRPPQIVLTATLLACAFVLPGSAQQNPTPKLKRVQTAESRKSHPEIDAAMTHLEEAKQNLEKGAHDFAGHRVAALKHVNEALEECRLALESAKH